MDIPVLDGNTRDLVDRLARVEGQIHGIARMIEERRRCDLIVVQLLAARAALEKVAAAVVWSSVEQCLTLPPDEAREMLGRSIGMLTQI